MPRRSIFARYYRKPIKVLIVEGLVFLSAFVLMAHLSVNFWDRYIIQNELSNMKANLYSMKETINKINVNYDHLNEDLESIAKNATTKKPTATTQITCNEPIHYKRNIKYGKLYQKDGQIQAVVAANAEIIGLMTDRSMLTKPIVVDTCTVIHKNATTLTKYPLKSKSAGSFAVQGFEEDEETVCFNGNCCSYVYKY